MRLSFKYFVCDFPTALIESAENEFNMTIEEEIQRRIKEQAKQDKLDKRNSPKPPTAQGDAEEPDIDDGLNSPEPGSEAEEEENGGGDAKGEFDENEA